MDAKGGIRESPLQGTIIDPVVEGNSYGQFISVPPDTLIDKPVR